MKNTILNSSSSSYREFGGYKYIDYGTHSYKEIASLIPDSYIEYVVLQDNIKLEKLSYDLYGSENYWDILAALNNIDPFFDLPYNYDIVLDSAQTKLDNYLSDYYKHTMSQEHQDRLLELFKEEADTENESYRSFKVIKTTYIQACIKILRDNKIIG